MHVSHQDKMISSSSYISKPINVACAVRFWAGGTKVHEVELSEESEEKERKSSCSEKSSSEKSGVESQKGHVVAHGHVVALEGRACAWACASLHEACAGFCPWFAKIICSPVSGTCLAEQSKPCANLAQTLRCLAVLLHLVGGPLLKENVKHANGTQMSRWSFFACYTFLESAHILMWICIKSMYIIRYVFNPQKNENMVDLLGTQCVPIFCGHTINIQQFLPRNIMAGHPPEIRV